MRITLQLLHRDMPAEQRMADALLACEELRDGPPAGAPLDCREEPQSTRSYSLERRHVFVFHRRDGSVLLRLLCVGCLFAWQAVTIRSR